MGIDLRGHDPEAARRPMVASAGASQDQAYQFGESTRLASVATRVKEGGGDPRVVRRLVVIARSLEHEPGIVLTASGDYEGIHSTKDMEFPGFDLGNDGAADDDQPTHADDIGFFDSHAKAVDEVPREGMVIMGSRQNRDNQDEVSRAEKTAGGTATAGAPVTAGKGRCADCGGFLERIGSIGDTTHFRCGSCGSVYTHRLGRRSPIDKGVKKETPRKPGKSKEKVRKKVEKVEKVKRASIAGPTLDARGDRVSSEETGSGSRKASQNVQTRAGDVNGPLYTSPKTGPSVWGSFKQVIAREVRRHPGGSHGSGGYRVETQDLGRAFDVSFQTYLADGAPLTGSAVTFGLRGEDAARRTATLDVHDPVSGQRSRTVRVHEGDIPRFAAGWVRRVQRVACRHLG
jgi:hypothetical protein